MSTVFAHVRRAALVALAGGAANAANVIVTVVIARLLSPRGYGALAVLVGLFFVLLMPGSALVVAVVRRVTAWEHHGHGAQVGAWAAATSRTAATRQTGTSSSLPPDLPRRIAWSGGNRRRRTLRRFRKAAVGSFWIFIRPRI